MGEWTAAPEGCLLPPISAQNKKGTIINSADDLLCGRMIISLALNFLLSAFGMRKLRGTLKRRILCLCRGITKRYGTHRRGIGSNFSYFLRGACFAHSLKVGHIAYRIPMERIVRGESTNGYTGYTIKKRNLIKKAVP